MFVGDEALHNAFEESAKHLLSTKVITQTQYNGMIIAKYYRSHEEFTDNIPSTLSLVLAEIVDVKNPHFEEYQYTQNAEKFSKDYIEFARSWSEHSIRQSLAGSHKVD